MNIHLIMNDLSASDAGMNIILSKLAGALVIFALVLLLKGLSNTKKEVNHG